MPSSRPTTRPMIVIELDGPALDLALDMMRNVIAEAESGAFGVGHLRVGIDPLDSGLKFSVDGGTWSPPVPGKITGIGND